MTSVLSVHYCFTQCTDLENKPDTDKQWENSKKEIVWSQFHSCVKFLSKVLHHCFLNSRLIITFKSSVSRASLITKAKYTLKYTFEKTCERMAAVIVLVDLIPHAFLLSWLIMTARGIQSPCSHRKQAWNDNKHSADMKTEISAMPIELDLINSRRRVG